MPGKLVRFSRDAIPLASGIIRLGGILVYPTDTVYGLGCDPHNSLALRELINAKRRGSRPIPVLCESLEYANRLVSLNQTALKLAQKHWPGALTIVAPPKASLPDELMGWTGNLGVRVPASALCVQLIRRCGGCLTGTSANLSGEDPCRTAEEALAKLGHRVDLILDGGRLTGTPSTVVQVSGEEIIVLRRGSVGVKD